MRIIFIIISVILLASCKKVSNEQHSFGVVEHETYQQFKGKPPRKNDTVVVPPTNIIDAIPPSITISQPLTNSIFRIGNNVTIKAMATDYNGIKSTSWYLDGALQDTSLLYMPIFTWNTSSSWKGFHTITVKAKDPAGNIGSAYVIINLDAAITPVVLPSSVILNTPPVQNQGNEGSCVAFSVGYYQQSIEWSYKTGTNIYLSPEFVYNQIKVSNCASGTSIIAALNLIIDKGICTWSAMPYSDQNGCDIQPNQSQLNEALNYKGRYFTTVKSNDPTTIKTMLYNKHPLVFSLLVDANFYNAKAGYIYNQSSPIKYAPHAITLVGYDDSKHAYKAINQWGTNWGADGFIWIDYDFFQTITYDLFVMNI